MPNFMFQFVPERQIMQTVKQDRFMIILNTPRCYALYIYIVPFDIICVCVIVTWNNIRFGCRLATEKS